MTDDQIKYLEIENTSGVLNLSIISNEAIMISNLPLLFAGGYPSCLEKFTLRQIEKFVPFMLQCSMGQSYMDKYSPAPKWWPEDLSFSKRVEKPLEMGDDEWFDTLKSMVCRCYTFHGCEFMLTFCTELSECPISTYRFVESWDGTTSLYNKETGRLMVTFRNENRDYDKEVETSPRRSLLPKNSTQNASRLMVQPPTFDIYLCDNCDGEFDSLIEVQDHERNCVRQDEDEDEEQDDNEDPDPVPIEEELAPEEPPPEAPDQETFLRYLSLRSVQKMPEPVIQNPVMQPTNRRRYPRGVTFARCCSVAFSSPLGQIIQQNARVIATKPQLINRVERHCVTRLRSQHSRMRDMDGKSQDPSEWPITWKPPHPKKSQDNWVHHYCFTQRERREKLATRLAGGLNWKSRRLLSMCRDVHVLVKRLTEEDIFYMTVRTQTPEPTTFQFPTLLPNTMYTYQTSLNCKPGYPQKIEVMQNPSMDFSPDPTIPVIDLVSTDEEELEDMIPISPQSICELDFGQSLHGIEEDEQMYCDRNNSHDLAVYPFIDTSTYDAFTQMDTRASCDEDKGYGTGSTSFPQSWQMNICIKSPSPSPTSAHVAYAEEQPYRLTKISDFQRKRRLQISPEPLQIFEHEVDNIVGTQLLQCSAASNQLEGSPGTRKMQTKSQFSLPSFEISSPPSCDLRVNTRSRLSLIQQKKNLNRNMPGHSPLPSDECDIVKITESTKTSVHRKRDHVKSSDTSRDLSHSKNARPSTMQDDTVDISVTKNSQMQRFLGKSLNSTVHAPLSSLKLQKNGSDNSVQYGSVGSSKITISSSKEQSNLVSSIPLSAPKSAFAQNGNATNLKQFNCDSSWDDSESRHSRFSSIHRRRNKRLASKKTTKAVEIILDDEEEDESPTYKKQDVHLYDSAVPAVSSTTQALTTSLFKVAVDKISIHTVEKSVDGLQDTSNNDVFGMSVMNEKATLSHQRCLANNRLPLSIRRLQQDECRELKRRGLHSVMNRGGRILRRHSEGKDGHLVDLGEKFDKDKLCEFKKELMKPENFARPGKVVTVSLMDNEVELIGNKVMDKDICNLENKKCWIPSECKTFEVASTKVKSNINCASKRTISTRSCPSLKIKQKLANILTSSDLRSSINCQKFNSNSWNCSSYSSPLVTVSVEPEQTLKYMMSNSSHSKSSSQSCKSKEKGSVNIEAKCLRNEYLNNEFNVQSDMKLNRNDCFSSDNVFEGNGEHCLKRQLSESSELCENFKMMKHTKSKEFRSSKTLQRQDVHSKYFSINQDVCVESCKRNLRRPQLVLDRYEYRRQCKKV